MTNLRAALAGLLCCATLAVPAYAQDATEDPAVAAMDFAMHDAAYTMYHEIGHLLVSELGLPVLGKEEDAADALAVILLLNDEENPDEAFNTLIDSADGWYFNAVKSTGEGVEDFSYYDEHSLDIQRAYAMVCMMVGFNPTDFKETADIYELDQDRQDACAYTYNQALDSWNTVLQPHFNNGDPGAEITVTYDDAGDFSQFADELKSRQILERAAALVTTKFHLPNPVSFRGTLCNQANAFYSPSDHQITYCYELAADMYGLYINDIAGAGGAATEGDTTGQDSSGG